MKSPFALPAAPSRTLLRRLGLGLIAVLLAGLAVIAQPGKPAQAAAPICTSIADGDWAAPTTWDCNRRPTNLDEVVVNDFEVLVSAPQAAAKVTITPTGVLRLTAATTLTLSGNLDVQGTFDDHVGGEVIFAAGSQQILTHSDWVDFSNLSKTLVNPNDTLSVDPPTCACSGGIHVLGKLKLLGSAANPLLLRSTASPDQWQLWAEGPQQIDYVNVMDANNVGDEISVLHGVDNGNNTGWVLGMVSSTVGLSASAAGSPVIQGQPVEFTAQVTPNTAAGSVTFRDGANPISGCVDVPVSDGAAECTTSDLPLGSRSITAVYSGDAATTGSTSAPFTQVVNAFSGISLTSSGSPSLLGASVTFSAMLMPMNAGDKVTFRDQDSPIDGCANISLDMKGMAMCETSALALGSHSITVEYHSIGNHLDGVSNPLVQWVMKSASLGVQSSKAPSILLDKVVFSVTGLPADATGAISYRDDGKDIPGCVNLPLGDPQPTCAVSNLVATTHHITVAYSGDSTYLASVSPALNQVVGWLNFFLPDIGKKK